MFNTEFLTSIYNKYIEAYFVNTLQIIFVLALTKLLLKYLNKLLDKLIKNSKTMSERNKSTLLSVTKSILKAVCYFIALCTIFSIIGINIQSFITIAGVGSVAVGFAAQELLKDFLNGALILSEDLYGIGDYITVSGKTGTVEKVHLRTTHIRGLNGELYMIPNGDIRLVTSMSKDFSVAIVNIAIGYEEDLSKVLSILENEMKKCEKTVKYITATPVILGITEFKDSSMNIRITAECCQAQNYAVERDLRKMIKLRFDKENISMPYPQTVVHKADN